MNLLLLNLLANTYQVIKTTEAPTPPLTHFLVKGEKDTGLLALTKEGRRLWEVVLGWKESWLLVGISAQL